MQAFEFIMKAEDGKIIIDMPKELEGKTFEIENNEISLIDKDLINFNETPAEERLKILGQSFGKDKYPDVMVNKYEVYNQ